MIAAMHRTLALALAVGLAGCGGGGGDDHSGVEPTAVVADLDPADEMTLCDWSIDAEGGAGHVTHCNGFDVTTHTVADCVAEFAGWTCDATVGELEDCINAIDGDTCALLTEEACAFLFTCSQP